MSYSEALKYTAERSKAQDRIFSNRSNAHLIAGNWKEALSDVEKALQIDPEDSVAVLNKCIALKKLGREEEAKDIIQGILPEIEEDYYRACAFAVLGEKKKMLKELEVAIEEDSGKRVDAKFDPDFADYRDDPDFRKLVYEAKE